ncbi:MAG: HPP family protein [Planctomycetota bacterium]
MKESKRFGPQHTLMFRFIKFLSRLQIGYRVRTMKNPMVSVAIFAVSAGAVSLAILTVVAYMTSLPLVFVPLAASAFILFYHPMSKNACPKNVILSHLMALVAGLFSFVVFKYLFPESNILNAWVMCWPRVAANALAMGMACGGMIIFRCVHSPAAATALIASTGFIVQTSQVFGFMAAVILLVLEALLLNRILGGFPYPLWGYDAKTAEEYGELADLSNGDSSFWHQFASRTSHRR